MTNLYLFVTIHADNIRKSKTHMQIKTDIFRKNLDMLSNIVKFNFLLRKPFFPAESAIIEVKKEIAINFRGINQRRDATLNVSAVRQVRFRTPPYLPLSRRLRDTRSRLHRVIRTCRDEPFYLLLSRRIFADAKTSWTWTLWSRVSSVIPWHTHARTPSFFFFNFTSRITADLACPRATRADARSLYVDWER